MDTPRIPTSIRRLAGKAIADFEMIRAGDRILVGLSGGKDSLTLLWLLHDLARRAPVRFEVGAVTIDPEIPGFEPGRLREYLAAYGIPWFFVSEPIAELAEKHMGKDSFCAFCARMKRGLMYRTLREQGYNVLALGQHLDDLAESFPDERLSRRATAHDESALPHRRRRSSGHPAAGLCTGASDP
jgi:tRNA 2-thiocytidine biosynthesis protein TtcA